MLFIQQKETCTKSGTIRLAYIHVYITCKFHLWIVSVGQFCHRAQFLSDRTVSVVGRAEDRINTMMSPLPRKRHIPTIASSITIYVVKWFQYLELVWTSYFKNYFFTFWKYIHAWVQWRNLRQELHETWMVMAFLRKSRQGRMSRSGSQAKNSVHHLC